VLVGIIVSSASKIGADRRVMGIALAIEPLQGWSGFLSAPHDYTLGALWIKSAAAGSGQLCICTFMPWVVLLHELSSTA